MKFENNNKDIIKRITKSSLKTNKIRNIFVVIAIILTTFMVSSVFTLGMSYAKNYRIMNLRDQGTTATTFIENPTGKQIEKIKSLNVAKNIGKEITVGNVSKEQLTKSKISIELKYLDMENWQEQLTPCISDIYGNYPNKENEAMFSKKALEFLNQKDVKIGDKIKVKYEIDGQLKEKEFILTGYYTTYSLIEDTGYILVSEDFINNNNLSLENNGKLLITLKNNKKYEAPELFKSQIPLKEKQEFQYNYDVEKDSQEILIASIAVVTIIGTFIVLSGYLFIYNILYIAVTKNIQFYGLLKTIGTSPKQIRKIVRGQGIKLSIVGIPVGLLISVLVSFLLIPFAMEGMSSGTYFESMMPNKIYFTPVVFISSILFSLFTVLISCRKPAKIASEISPIEAMSYSGKKTKKENKNRNSTNGGKLYKMAWYNVFRDKKRAILVFLSLFMGIITFLSVNTFMNSISVDNYAKRYLINDFEIQNYYDDNTSISNKIIQEIKDIKGVKAVEILSCSKLQLDMNENVIMPALKYSYDKHSEDKSILSEYLSEIKKNPSRLSPWIIGVDDTTIDKANENNDYSIDTEAFKNGKLALIDGFNYDKNEKLDFFKEKITLRNIKYNKDIELNVSLINDKSSLLGFYGANDLGVPEIFVSTSVLDKIEAKKSNYALYIDAEDKYDSLVKSKLKIIASKNRLQFSSKTDMMENFNKSSMMMNVVGGGISIILIFIGLLNFINVMVTNINVRLRELAIMESIGMTKKQINKMLTIEGLYYAGITTLITCTVGMGVVYAIAKLTKSIADYAEFIFPTIPLILLITLIFAVCLITPSIVYKFTSKKTVTERLKEVER